jgi:hypothetical protein
VKQPKLLTDRCESPLFKYKPLGTERTDLKLTAWNNIKSEMVDFMEGMKAFRLGRERVATLQRRRQHASIVLRDFKQTHRALVDTPEKLVPGAADFWTWPAISALINSPPESSITLEQFQNVRETIPAFFASWHRARTREIMDKLYLMDLPYAREYSEQCQQMRLAVSVFICQKGLCHNDLEESWKPHQYRYYPEYMHHRCNRIRRVNWSDPEADDPPLSLGDGYQANVVRQQWTCEHLEYDEKASRVVRKILQDCGWDWKTMTVEELDRLDPRLVCLKCTYGHRCDGERRVSVRNWRSAVRDTIKFSILFFISSSP